MPHSNQTNGVIHRNGDSLKSSAYDKTSLRPLELQDYSSASQEQDPNFSYEKDKSSGDVSNVVEKFLPQYNGNMIENNSHSEAKSVINDLTKYAVTEDILRKRKPFKDEEKLDVSVKTLPDQIQCTNAETNGDTLLEMKSSSPIKNIQLSDHVNNSSVSEHTREDNNAIGSNNTNDTHLEKVLLDQDNSDACKDEQSKLLLWEDMPKHLQFNPYVKTGYRPLLSVWGCVYSLFYIHNETVNILTHGLPIIYIIYVVPKLLPWEADAGFPFLAWCHLAGALAPWCGSFLYHLFMNTSRGAQAYNRLLQLDMLGIWVSQSFGALPMLTATTYCMPWLTRWTIISAYCLLSIWGLYKALTAWSPWERRICFLFPFTMRAVLAWFRAGGNVGGNPAALSHIILQDAVSAIGGVIGAVNIPERWFPGAVDMCLNSHNIMHVLVVTAVYFMHKATVLDIRWMSEVQCRQEEVSLVPTEDMLPGIIYQL